MKTDAYIQELLERQEAEQQPAARSEKIACLLMIVIASFIIGATIFAWCRDERGFSSTPVLAWPASVVTASVAAVVGYIATKTVSIGKRWRVAGTTLVLVIIVWRFC